MADPSELLFFDTFSHETSEELNLDLVQFPKPVFVTEVRIIPLGARVQADFPGGVRLGATNPSQFSIEFFVNDLGKPGASTFESLGGFDYNQNGCIHLECKNNEVTGRQIPTDGLVLRGWYTTITLAVYGTLTKNISEQIVNISASTPSISQQPTALVSDVQQIVSANTIEQNWQPDVAIASVSLEYNQNSQVNYPTNYGQTENYNQDYHHMEYYNNDGPKDPRYHPDSDWDQKSSRQRETSRSRENDSDHRESEKHYSRSHSRDRERDRDRDRDRDRERDREWDRERSRDRNYKHQETYKRSRDSSYGRGISQDRDEPRKRPRTPPPSPKRPHTPQSDKNLSPGDVESISEDEIAHNDKTLDITHNKSDVKQNTVEQKKVGNLETNESVEDTGQMDLEPFEPILSDEDICDEDNFHEIDYDFSAYSNNDDVIKIFNPLTTDLQKYHKSSYLNLQNLFEIEDAKKFADTLNNYFSKYEENVENLLTLVKENIQKYEKSDFKNLAPEIKEEFVQISEQLSNLLSNNEQFFTFLKILSRNPSNKNLNSFYSELESLFEALLSFINISLDFDCAFSQNQPGFKIRHIKCGIRLVESCTESDVFLEKLVENGVHEKLLSLFHREYMALSIKLMILKALDSSLSTEKSIENFTSQKFSGKNGYQALINILKTVSSVRIKFSVNSLLTKLNIFELLRKVRQITNLLQNEASTEQLTLIFRSLDQILKLLRKGALEISQPKRFLPVSAQFDISRSQDRNILFNLFQMQNLLGILLVLLTHKQTSRYTFVWTTIHEIISIFLDSPEGLEYLTDNIQSTNLLMKLFLSSEDLEAQYVLSEAYLIKSRSLGLQIALKVQAFYYVESLFDLTSSALDSCEVLEKLHDFYCLTFLNSGKLAVCDVLSFGENMNCLLQFLPEKLSSKLKKSPSIGYLIDLIALAIIHSSNVPFLEKFGKRILKIAQQFEKFETVTAMKLNEILSFLKPLESFTISYDDIKPICEVMKENLENFPNFSGEIVTCLRILKYLGISENFLEESGGFQELKYKYVILQLFSLDGIQNLLKTLEKITSFYEQPNLHISTFSSIQGALIIYTVLPTVQLLKQMLTNVIFCRNVDFKDLTAIPILLKTFNLAFNFPQSSIVFKQAQNVCQEIVDCLLVYSQPISEKISENDSLNRTLWTLMTGEVLKYITLTPFNFIPGLLIFSELLPLPLPVQTVVPLTETELKRVVNLRKLWSAHLHSHTNLIQDLITKLIVSINQQLLHILRRVCVQLASLAANSAVSITRAILDCCYNFLSEQTENSLNSSKVLYFLACLTTHATIKSSALQLLSNSSKSDEKYTALFMMFCQILKSDTSSNLQKYVLNIFQNFCDAEISLIQNPSSDFFLANSLPVKEMLNHILQSSLENLNAENPLENSLAIFRIFILLSEHNFGFFHLTQSFQKFSFNFLSILQKFAEEISKENLEILENLATLLEFLRINCEILEAENSGLFQARTLKFSVQDLKNLVGWNNEEFNTDFSKHPLPVLENSIKKHSTTEEPFQNILDNLSTIIRYVSATNEPLNENLTDLQISTAVEPVLPLPETLLSQFTYRPVFTLTDATEEQLTSSYWLSIPLDEAGNEVDYVNCDLTDICRQFLPPEINISREIEKLIRVFPSQDTDRQTSEEMKVKRSSNDGQRSDKMKKPYVTPMRGRGFPRTGAQRGDLFRSRPPNTSRPPSLHVDDFVALETCGAQPTGPTGYNKLSRDILNTRVVRSVRGRNFISPERAVHFRPL